VECLSPKEYNVREGLSKAETSKAQRGFNVLDFTKETKSEKTGHYRRAYIQVQKNKS